MKNAIKLSLIAAIIIALGIGTLYVLDYFRLAKDKNPANLTQQKPDEIIITDLPTGEKLVENKTQGYSIQILDKWNTEKSETGYISFNNIDLSNPKNEFCKIENHSIPNLQNLTTEQWLNRDDVKLNESFMTIIQDKRSEIIIGGQKGIKRIFETTETGLSVAVMVSLNQKIYEFVIYPKSEDKEKCLKDFDSYLKSIQFK